MPELSHQSSILSEQHVLQLSNSLPPRTIGYKWSLAYSTNLHGFSLKRLYREVARIDSPILLVLRDTENTVFGAFLSEPPKLSDHFFGTGMCQLWTFKDKFRSFCWTGENVFFIKGDENSMSVGAGQGVYGLWLDSDLYHGRSHQCSTFNNIVLSTTEDFCISALEAWAFVSD
ncbi:TLD domain-containing protein 2-like [Babylonia areolata]|uniref:TLD domain-containing protein 2-like n=1 Tax=Babylonia areolata TaxID=304850 RepID=UPI003FD2E7FB